MKITALMVPFLLSLGSSLAAIDLTPRFLAQEADGTTTSRPYFTDGNKRFGIKIDSETKVIPYDNGALFRFKNFPDARMQLLHSPVEAGPFNEERLPLCEAAARKLLPEGAAEVVLIESTSDPIPLNDWTSYRFTFSYRSAGQARRQSITFLNLDPATQIIMQVAAREKNFELIGRRSFDIIRRWHEVPAGSVTRYY
jgi:hypothetical protein